MALKLSGSISLTGSLASNSSIEATVVSSSFFTGSYLDGLGNSGSADEVLISDGTGASVYQEINFLTNQGVTPASINEFSISWEGGLNFSASALKVFGPGESFSRKQLDNKLITLSSADSTNPRFDVFVFRINENDTTSGSIEVIEGTANANPVYPDIDGNTEVPLKFVLIKAGASLPSDGSNEDDTNTSDFSSANIYSDNAFDGNTWYTHGTSDTGANVSGSIFAFSANNQRDYEYGNTVHGTAIKWPRTGYYNKFARAARIAFAHPSWESNGGIAVGDLDQLKLDIKFPSATTGDTLIAKQYRTQVYSNMYIEVWLYSGVQKSNSTYSVTTVAKSRINIGRTLDLTSDQFQTVTIDQAAMQKYNAGKVTSGTKINYILINFYKNQWPYNSNGLGVPIADGLFIDNITWVNGSGASPQLDPGGKSISKATASEPVALSGKNNNASGTSTAIVAGENNTITTDRSFIGAGRSNLITGNTDSVIGGGSFNSSSNSCTFIGGGSNNILTGSAVSSSIIGGLNNSSSLANTHIIGSNITADKANYTYVNNLDVEGTVSGSTFSGSFVGDGSGLTGIAGGGTPGGSDTQIQFNDNGSFGGSSNLTFSGSKLIVGGTISGSGCLIIGTGHTVSGITFSIAGGRNHTICSNCSFIGGGCQNQVHDSISGIVAGRLNCIMGGGTSMYNMIGAGQDNCITGSSGNSYNFIGGGISNRICDAGTAFIGSGNSICIIANSGVVVGGVTNQIDSTNAYAAFIGSGTCNYNRGRTGVIGGGCRNLLSGDFSILGGGCQNTSSGDYSGILGGTNNYACETESFIIGSNLTSSAACTTFMNNLDVEGTVSASIFSGSFVGDGSGLTGISGGGGADDDWGDAGTYISSSKGISVTGGITGSALTIGNNHTTVGGSALASILAGSTNCLSASNYSAIIGGAINRVKTSAASTISHGCSNCISGSGMSIAGGRSNCVMDADCVGVLSGFCNLISGSNWNIIGGGYQNSICRTTYGAGGNNVIGGGQENCITGGGSWTGYATFIGAGRFNTGSGGSSAIGAGMNNSVSAGDKNFIGAGFCNCIYNSGDNNFIGSGELNKINSYSTGSNIIVGGCQNCVEGTFGTIVGGRQNCVTHKDSFVAGTCITSSAENTFYVNNLYSTGSDGSNNVVILANLPTSDPTNAGQLWNDSGTLKISAG